jgi:dihydroorotate dehydrogenase (NAD+) catalytic subunit
VSVDLTTSVGSVELASPIMTASGTAGHGAELGAYVDLGALGAVVVKSLAHFAWDGNPPLRVHSTPAGMINSVGLQGPGVSAWIDDELPTLINAGATVVASIWGKTVDDYQKAAELLAPLAADHVVAVEVNISCPNTEAGNELFAHSTSLTETVLSATEGCGRPRWAKLSPNVGPALADIAGAAVDGGAEAVTVANTWMGLVIDPRTRRPRLGGGRGGVSGPAIRPLTVRAVADVRAAHPDLPIIGAGGIATVEDVIEYTLVGASAVQVGTATLADPHTCSRLGAELVRWCAKEEIRRYDDLIGRAVLDR